MGKRIAFLLSACLLAGILTACDDGGRTEAFYPADESEEVYEQEDSAALDEDASPQASGDRGEAMYEQGLADGKYAPLNPDIYAIADDLTVEYWQGQYLLCTGGDHAVFQATKEWMDEPSFYQSGSIVPIPNEDIFAQKSVSYFISGGAGTVEAVGAGDTDLMPVFEAMGALGAEGAVLCRQTQICARSSFDAASIYLLSEDEDGIISAAMLVYSEEEGLYLWDGQEFITTERCCFDEDGVFYYVDTNGNLQSL